MRMEFVSKRILLKNQTSFFLITYFLLLVFIEKSVCSQIPSPSNSLPQFRDDLPIPHEIEESLDSEYISPLQFYPDPALVAEDLKPSFNLIQDECMTISMDEGSFHHKSKGSSEVCGVYLTADPDQLISITIDFLNAPCQSTALISVVDGWELNGELFPSDEDYLKNKKGGMGGSGEERFNELCGSTTTTTTTTTTGTGTGWGTGIKGRFSSRRTYTSSQNVATLQYRLPKPGQGFSITVRHLKNEKPCNILVQDTDAIYTIRNFGYERNCSLTTLFDAKIRVLQLQTGTRSKRNHRLAPTTLFHNCGKLGLRDFVELGGSGGLDTSKMTRIDEFCGSQAIPSRRFTTILCGLTTVRLVSGPGGYQNRVVVEVKKAGLEDLENANYICTP